MSVLSITAFKTKYYQFTGFNSQGNAQFEILEHVKLHSCFNSDMDGLRYAVCEVIAPWQTSNGTLPSYFRIESKEGDKIFHIRLANQGEEPNLTTPNQGDWFATIIETIRG